MKDLRFGYNDKDVLKGISFEVRPGEVVAVLGRNGSGKTTLLKNIIGLLKPRERGMVLLNGNDVKDLKVEEAARIAGFLFQNPDNMLFAETVMEEVMFSPTNLGFTDSIERSMKALEEVDLLNKKEEYPRYLGNGEKLRLCVASILAMGPRIIILDEPTTGLDDNECSKLMEVVLKLKKEGVAIMMVSHDMNLVARYANHVIIIAGGEIFKQGSPAEVLKDSAALGAASLKSPADHRAFRRARQGMPDDRRVQGGRAMSEIFQYVDGNSFIHNLNPLTKILFCAFIIITGILSGDPLILLVLLALPMIGLLSSGMIKEIRGQLKMLSVIFLFLIIVTILTVRSGAPYAFGGITLFTYRRPYARPRDLPRGWLPCSSRS